MSPVRVSVVILAWNAWDKTKACLEALRPTLGATDETIVVDNGSTDGTAAGLTRYPWVKTITTDANRGFAAGCNQGAALSR
ncbi:MAG: glycosyltransferase family 2 protein, partial [Acidimicrobiales bacterium]